MLKNSSLKEIGTMLENAGSVLLFPHVNPDGDSIGACTALCHHLRKIGVNAWILAEGKIPDHVAFLDEGIYTEDLDIIKEPDVCICVDCHEISRFPKRVSRFLSGKKKLCIDHHRVEECSWDRYYIDSDEAASCQIIYRLFLSMGWEPDTKEAHALYTGITSDTGCFQYSNTTADTHRIAADLIEAGADVNQVTIALFQSVDPRTAAVKAKALQKMQLLADGRAAVSSLSTEERLACGAEMEHTDTIVEDLRNIVGVEVSAFVKEDGDLVRVSMRAKTERDVGSVARRFGGGGHMKAAGCSMKVPLDEAVGQISEEITKLFTD